MPTNPPYQPTAPVRGQKPLQAAAPPPNSRGFMPVPNSGVVQRPGVGSVQPISTPQVAPVQPTTPQLVPAPTVQTADSSNVPGK